MRFFADNSDYRAAKRNQQQSPVTERMLHEDAAGMGLDDLFFAISGINPDAPVKCTCKWDDEGHEPHCDIVAANKLLFKAAKPQDGKAHPLQGKE